MVTRALSAAEEAERMQRVPGIIFVDGAVGRRAHVAGTGLDVFEIIKIFYECGETRAGLKEGLYWHSDANLEAALRYYALYPDEINDRLRREDEITPEHLRANYRFKTPIL